MKEALTVLPSITPEAYLDQEQFPIPGHEQNEQWHKVISLGIESRSRLDDLHVDVNAGREGECGISSEQKAELTLAVQAGQAARMEMWQSNLRLVDYVIDSDRPAFAGNRRYVGNRTVMFRGYVQDALELHPNLDKEDIRQMGREGLIKAIDGWDPGRAAFSTYATRALRSIIRRQIMMESTTIRIKSLASTTMEGVSRARNTAYEQSSLEGGYSDELAELCNHPDYYKTTTQPLIGEPDFEIGDDQEYSEPRLPAADRALVPSVDAENLSAQDSFNIVELRTDLVELFDRIGDPRTREIIALRFGFLDGQPRTLEQIGVRMNLTRERIRQIEAQTLAALWRSSRPARM